MSTPKVIGVKTFSTRLKMLRGSKSQAEMARRFGVSQVAYGKWELGKAEPKFDVITDICKNFSVSSDWLLGLSDDRTPTARPKLVRVETEHGAKLVGIVQAGEKTKEPAGEVVVLQGKRNRYGRRRTVIVKKGREGELETVPVSRKAFARLVRQVANQQKTLDSLTAKKRRTVKLVKV